LAEKVLIIGAVHPQRGDDAAGVLVAQRLVDLEMAGVRVVEHDGEVAQLIDLMESAETVFLVDTAISSTGGGGNLPSGTIRRFEAHRQPLPGGIRTYSTHAMGVAEAIELARALDRLPQRLVVHTIEGISFGFGEQPGEAVMTGVQQVAERIRMDLATAGYFHPAGE